MDQTLEPFIDLAAWLPGEMPGDTQKRAAAQLPALLDGSHLARWTPATRPPAAGRWLLVGCVVWSRYDLALLDRLNAAVRAGLDVAVCVFDLDTLTPERLESLIPGLGPVLNPPVAGLWVDGILTASAAGPFGRNLVDDLMQPVPTRT